MFTSRPWSTSSGWGDLIQILYEMCFTKNLSGNEIYRTIVQTMLVKITLCGNFHCQKVFNLKHISNKITHALRRRLALQWPFQNSGCGIKEET